MLTEIIIASEIIKIMSVIIMRGQIVFAIVVLGWVTKLCVLLFFVLTQPVLQSLILDRVRTGPGKLATSWNFIRLFPGLGGTGKKTTGRGKSCKSALLKR